MQQIAGKINTNIFPFRRGRILKLIAKMSKKYKIFPAYNKRVKLTFNAPLSTVNIYSTKATATFFFQKTDKWY